MMNKNLEMKIDETLEMMETINREFCSCDGAHFDEDPVDWGYLEWHEWLEMANEVHDFRWQSVNMKMVAMMLTK